MRLLPAEGTPPALPIGGKVAPFGRERSTESTHPDMSTPKPPTASGRPGLHVPAALRPGHHPKRDRPPPVRPPPRPPNPTSRIPAREPQPESLLQQWNPLRRAARRPRFPVPALRNSDRQSLRPIPDAPRQPCNRHPHGGRPGLAHASEIERAGGVDGAAAELDGARVFIPAARRRARRNIRALRTNQDDRLTAIAERALENADLAPPSPLMLLAR